MGEKLKNKPLVTIICICYNHEQFVEKAILSVLHQEYPNIELIVLDDCSSDGSVNIIRNVLTSHPEIIFIENDKTYGICKAFNKAYKLSSGDFIIDFSADDILEPSRVNYGVQKLDAMGSDYGVHYSDAWIINEASTKLYRHSESSNAIQKIKIMPEGDVFTRILKQYFICPPTTMGRRSVFEFLHGYDEDLDYEDFDFLVRSSRKYKFCYSPETLVQRRIVQGSKSSGLKHPASLYHESTYEICRKAFGMVRNKEEQAALNNRLFFECRQVIRLKNREIAKKYVSLMKENGVNRPTRWLYFLAIVFLA